MGLIPIIAAIVVIYFASCGLSFNRVYARVVVRHVNRKQRKAIDISIADDLFFKALFFSAVWPIYLTFNRPQPRKPAFRNIQHRAEFVMKEHEKKNLPENFAFDYAKDN